MLFLFSFVVIGAAVAERRADERWVAEIYEAAVNLDGVMNDHAIAAIRNQRLCEYIDDQRIGYLADNEQAIEFFLSRDRSCETAQWRTQWEVVHRLAWPPDATNVMTFVVMKRR
jgi:hypothetical protein